MGDVIHYLALGDSLTAGYGAPPALGFADQLRSIAEAHLSRPVKLDNHGVNGLRAAEILNALKTERTIQDSLEAADLITITAGGNDMLQAADQFVMKGDRQILKQAVKSCKSAYKEMFTFIQAYKHSSSSNHPYLIRVADLYNPVPAFSESVFWVHMFNKMLRHYSSLPHLVIVDMYAAFLHEEQRLLSDDFIHPNEEGYRVMAEQIAACGFDDLV